MRFSEIEKMHLLKAWIAVSLAFGIILGDILSPTFLIIFAISLFTVGTGFLLHEIAHKLVAQRYGCFAEFRANDRMLIFAIFSAFLGFVFAAPGAVFISGNITKEKNGKISFVGPFTNFILALIYLGISSVFSVGGMLASALKYGFQINAFIALFNMIPFLNFDGQKIWAWNKVVYIIFITLSAALVIVSQL